MRWAVALVLVVGACKPALPLGPERGGVRFVERFVHGADARSPLIIAIHGRGGQPDGFASLFDDYPGSAEIALPQAFERYGFGWSWFDWPPGMSDDELARVVGAAEEKLWAGIVEVAHGRRVVVTGFSQGGVLSYVLAARHPDAIRLAVPIAGGAPYRLQPRAGARTAPVYALHGDADPVIGVDFARATVAAFTAAGGRAELHEYAGVRHAVSAPMRADLYARIASALATP